MTRYSKYLLTAGIVAFMFLMGLKRDFIFVSINKILQNILSIQSHGLSPLKASIVSFTYLALYSLKWYLTIACAFIYLFFGCLSIYILFRKTAYIYWMLVFFASVFLFAFLFILIGSLSGNYSICYVFARKLMGLAQSPALLMILIPAFKLLKD